MYTLRIRKLWKYSQYRNSWNSRLFKQLLGTWEYQSKLSDADCLLELSSHSLKINQTLILANNTIIIFNNTKLFPKIWILINCKGKIHYYFVIILYHNIVNQSYSLFLVAPLTWLLIKKSYFTVPRQWCLTNQIQSNYQVLIASIIVLLLICTTHSLHNKTYQLFHHNCLNTRQS